MKLKTILLERNKEFKILIFRILLIYFFYSISRIGFYFYNKDQLQVEGFQELLKLLYHGWTFDSSAILLTNSLFIILSLLPFLTAQKRVQKILFWLYFGVNGFCLFTNFIDFIYYKFIYSRTTVAVLDILQHENQKSSMFFRFLWTYLDVALLYSFVLIIWRGLYLKFPVRPVLYHSKSTYLLKTGIVFLFSIALMLYGIRGDLRYSTRPINLIDANRYVSKIQHADLVLNTPFTLIRTIGKNNIKKQNWVKKSVIDDLIQPLKQYQNYPSSKPNIVLIITESFGREYWGCMNKNTKIYDYQGFTPFLDSLSEHSLIFPNAFANGSKSIHGMSSVIAGIPSFRDAFTSSPYANQKIESLVSILKSIGYTTSFFHGAPNGSMGFLGFSSILGFDKYIGKTEYNNNQDFDGTWGIWDEEFLQFMKNQLDKEKSPFFATLFTVSSHEPYQIPKKYEKKFPKGTIPMHASVGYTDFAFRKFFEVAQRSDWFKNTLFVITADHPNQVGFSEYNKIVNRSAVPILFYSPSQNLKGIHTEIAQQIDIYPSILDWIGYKKPFRSWGRSLISESKVKPFALNFNGNQYQFLQGNYICTFDGQEITGYYSIEDKGLTRNLISQKTPEMEKIGEACQAFLQDYFERIVDRKL